MAPHSPRLAAVSLAVGLAAAPAGAGQAVFSAQTSLVNVAVTQGSFNAEENQMAADFAAVMGQEFPGIKLIAPQLEGFEPSGAKAKAIALLQGNPAVTGAFSTTGNGAETWAGASGSTAR